MSKYFNDLYTEYIYESKGINKYFLDEEMVLVAGDFYGIQKFIFDGLSTKNAAKVLRAKSAFIQIFTRYIAEYTCDKFNVDSNQIISSNAGKFEIIVPKKDQNLLIDIQKKIDDFFIDKFFGLSGMSVVSVPCSKNDFTSTKSYKELRKKISDRIEVKKFSKFSLVTNDNFVMKYDSDISNQNLCNVCNIRKGKNNCSICKMFISLGEQLVKDQIKKINSSELLLDFDNYAVDIEINQKIKSYIRIDEEKKPVDFTHLAEASCNDEKGVKSLAVLKADVDSMGNFLRDSDVTDSFENFDHFSNTIDNFFSLYIPKLMKENYKDTYTVFAGGDDLFLLGAWDQVLELAKEVQTEFKKFINTDKLTISFGIALVKPSYPVSRIAEYTEELLEKSKEKSGKDAITLFGETVKWDTYLQNYSFISQLRVFDENTSMLYRLLELVKMSKSIDLNMENTMWKSKLNYSFHRNVDMSKVENQNLLKTIDEMIERNPEETKMYLSEFIYKRRVA